MALTIPRITEEACSSKLIQTRDDRAVALSLD